MALEVSYTEEVFKTYATAKHRLGTPLRLPDGSVYRFGKAGLTALAHGKLHQGVVPVAAAVNIAVQAAVAAGALVIPVTLGATAVVVDEYKDGYIYVNDAGADVTTEGYIYRVKSHLANAGSATLLVNLYEDSPVKVALTTNSEVTLQRNKFNGCIIHPSPPTGMLAGVPRVDIPISNYGWFQTKGPAAVLTEGTLVQARSAIASPTTDGAVSPNLLTEGTPNVETQFVVGRVISVNATTEYSLIDLSLE